MSKLHPLGILTELKCKKCGKEVEMIIQPQDSWTKCDFGFTCIECKERVELKYLKEKYGE